MTDRQAPKRVYKEAEAAEYVGMSRAWLRATRGDNGPDGPEFVRIGRAIRYFREDLDAWLDDMKVQTQGKLLDE